MIASSANMTASSSGPPYALGRTDAEHERLIWQAARLAPCTERLFREAGIGPGQRVLDLGSGVGDVAMLAAQLVGPSGQVMGVERDSRSIARAKARVADAGLHNVSFIECDVSEISWDKPFDAAVGRFILEFIPEQLRSVRGMLVFRDKPDKLRRYTSRPGRPRLMLVRARLDRELPGACVTPLRTQSRMPRSSPLAYHPRWLATEHRKYRVLRPRLPYAATRNTVYVRMSIMLAS